MPNHREIIQMGFMIRRYPHGPNLLTQAALKTVSSRSTGRSWRSEAQGILAALLLVDDTGSPSKDWEWPLGVRGPSADSQQGCRTSALNRNDLDFAHKLNELGHRFLPRAPRWGLRPPNTFHFSLPSSWADSLAYSVLVFWPTELWVSNGFVEAIALWQFVTWQYNTSAESWQVFVTDVANSFTNVHSHQRCLVYESFSCSRNQHSLP